MILLILATAISLHKCEGVNSHVTVYTADIEKVNPDSNIQYKDNKIVLQTAVIQSKARRGKGRDMMLVIPPVFKIKEKGLPSQGNLLLKYFKISEVREQSC